MSNCKTTKQTNKNGQTTTKDSKSINYRRGKKGGNDISFYNADPTVLNNAAKIPMNWNLGLPFELNRHGALTVNEDLSCRLPGVMAINYVPTYGKGTGTQDDPMNVAALQIYQFLTHSTTATRPYDYPDVMQYLICCDSLLYMIAWAERVYGLALKIDHKNSYLPDALLSAMYVNPDSIKLHYADFRAALNLIIAEVNQLYVPGTIKVFGRHKFLVSNIYTDGAMNDQVYFYDPEGWYALGYDEQHKPVAKYIEKRVSFKKPMDYNDIITTLRGLLSFIKTDQDFNILGADFAKAYGTNQMVTLDYVPELVTIQFSTDIGALDQLRNTRIVNLPALEAFADKMHAGSVTKHHSFDVLQNSTVSALIQDLSVQITAPTLDVVGDIASLLGTYDSDPIIDTAGDGSVDNIVEVTRNVSSFTWSRADGEAGTSIFTVTPEYGSELFTNVEIVFFNHTGEQRSLRLCESNQVALNNTLVFADTTDMSCMYHALQWITENRAFKFGMRNPIYWTTKEIIVQDSAYCLELGDFGEHWTVVDRAQLQQIHDAVVFNQFKPINLQITAFGNK